jgi:hypothetical protein
MVGLKVTEKDGWRAYKLYCQGLRFLVDDFQFIGVTEQKEQFYFFYTKIAVSIKGPTLRSRVTTPDLWNLATQ